MAEPLKFKRRVDAPPEDPVRQPRPGRSWVPVLGAAAWLATGALCLAIVEGWIPVASWLLGEQMAEQYPDRRGD